jgi:hypothetical protein
VFRPPRRRIVTPLLRRSVSSVVSGFRHESIVPDAGTLGPFVFSEDLSGAKKPVAGLGCGVSGSKLPSHRSKKESVGSIYSPPRPPSPTAQPFRGAARRASVCRTDARSATVGRKERAAFRETAIRVLACDSTDYRQYTSHSHEVTPLFSSITDFDRFFQFGRESQFFLGVLSGGTVKWCGNHPNFGCHLDTLGQMSIERTHVEVFSTLGQATRQ